MSHQQQGVAHGDRLPGADVHRLQVRQQPAQGVAVQPAEHLRPRQEVQRRTGIGAVGVAEAFDEEQHRAPSPPTTTPGDDGVAVEEFLGHRYAIRSAASARYRSVTGWSGLSTTNTPALDSAISSSEWGTTVATRHS